MKIHLDFSISLSRFSKFFVLTDFILLSGWGLIGPVFALFIVDSIPGASAVTVGIATAIYWLVKSSIQIPIANFLDKTDGEKDDFRALLIGLLLSAAAAFSYLAVSKIWHLYLVELLHAIAFAFYVPAWSGLFTRHLEKEKSSLGWSLDSTMVGIAIGITGLIGGYLFDFVGYALIFILTGVLTLMAAAVVMWSPNLLLPKPATNEPLYIKNHIPRK